MSKMQDRVEILIDPDTRSWVRDDVDLVASLAHVSPSVAKSILSSQATRSRCQVYEDFGQAFESQNVGTEAERIDANRQDPSQRSGHVQA
eukprot:symbB.v1.2.031623.t1/scaffold3689.1/size51974/10